MKKNFSKGFTLIELLVVIAIIGILASVVLASLNSARAKGNDAKVKSQVTLAMASAESFYDTNNGYGGASTDATCASALYKDTVSSMATYVNTANYPTGTSFACTSGPTFYVLAAKLQSGAANSYWCVDNLGTPKVIVMSKVASLKGTESSCDAMATAGK